MVTAARGGSDPARRLCGSQPSWGPPDARPAEGLVVDFVVESDRARLGQVVQRGRDRRLQANIANVATLDDDAFAALKPTERRNGKTIIRIRP